MYFHTVVFCFVLIKCVGILTDVLKRMLSEMLKLTYLVEEVQILFVDLKWKYVQMLLVSMLCYCSVYDKEHMNCIFFFFNQSVS